MHSWFNLGSQDKDPESVLQLNVLHNSKLRNRELESSLSPVLQLSPAAFPFLLLSVVRKEVYLSFFQCFLRILMAVID